MVSELQKKKNRKTVSSTQQTTSRPERYQKVNKFRFVGLLLWKIQFTVKSCPLGTGQRALCLRDEDDDDDDDDDDAVAK